MMKSVLRPQLTPETPARSSLKLFTLCFCHHRQNILSRRRDDAIRFFELSGLTTYSVSSRDSPNT